MAGVLFIILPEIGMKALGLKEWNVEREGSSTQMVIDMRDSLIKTTSMGRESTTL